METTLTPIVMSIVSNTGTVSSIPLCELMLTIARSETGSVVPDGPSRKTKTPMNIGRPVSPVMSGCLTTPECTAMIGPKTVHTVITLTSQ